jgi:hypothetical protein
MASRTERLLIRVLIGAALCVAVLVSTLTPAPPSLPAVTFEQAGLYRLEVALLVFYGCLLLMTPAFSGLARGRLPTEISVRGAKFEEKAEDSVEVAEARIEELEQRITDLADGLTAADIEIDRLKG